MTTFVRTAYIAGALTNVPPELRELLQKFYVELGGVCREFGFFPYIPHIYADPKTAPHLTKTQVDRIDRLAVTLSYIVIAYIGVPSTGVGIEIECANHANKPVVVFYEKEKHEARLISRLVRGNRAIWHEIAFKDFEDAKRKLRKFLTRFCKKIGSENLPEPLSV